MDEEVYFSLLVITSCLCTLQFHLAITDCEGANRGLCYVSIPKKISNLPSEIKDYGYSYYSFRPKKKKKKKKKLTA